MSLKLTGAAKYSPDRLEDLQNHVAKQASEGTYDRDANLALLRAYNFEPDLVHGETLAKALLLALMRLPDADFLLLRYLIPIKVQENALISAVISLDEKLETFQFMQFWQEADQLRDVLKPVAGFQEAVRRFILQSLTTTFHHLQKNTLAQSLRLDGSALDELIEKKVAEEGWHVTTDGVVSLPKKPRQDTQQQQSNAHNQIEKLVPVLKLAA